MHRLHDRLSAREPVLVSVLAEEFGVSERTIKRDIRVMRDDHGAPIVWDAMTRCYAYTRPFTILPLLRITESEALVLALSARRFGASRGSPLARAFVSLLKKVGPLVGGDTSLTLDALRDVLVETDTLAASEDRHIPALHEAINRCRELRVNYRKPGESPRPRTLRPLHLAYIGHRWMLLARDVTKPTEDHTYLLSRMEEIAETGDHFKRPADFDPEKVLRGNLRRFTGKGDYEIRIALDAMAAAYARDQPWHASQTLTERPDGRCELALRLNNLVDVEKDVLRCGEHAEVLSPPELRTRLHEIHRAALAHYAKE
jgi:proteasome accessory factor B